MRRDCVISTLDSHFTRGGIVLRNHRGARLARQSRHMETEHEGDLRRRGLLCGTLTCSANMYNPWDPHVYVGPYDPNKP